MSNVASQSGDPLLRVEGVTVGTDESIYRGRRSVVVRDASFVLPPGGSLGILGESGSGKTALVQCLFGYARPGLSLDAGVVAVQGRALSVKDTHEFVQLRGRVLSLVPQSANAMFNPIMTVGQQLSEICRAVGLVDRDAIRARILTLFGDVGLSNPEAIITRYPHELSGGQRQRIVLCMALVSEPDVLILDEATSDLDVITQLRILRLIRALRERHGFGLVVVSHDLKIIAALCTAVLIMYRALIVETGSLESVLSHPGHPYTAALVKRASEGPVAAALVTPALEAEEDGDTGCVYRPHCPMARERCLEAPELLALEGSRAARCWFASEVEGHFGVTSKVPAGRGDRGETSDVQMKAVAVGRRSAEEEKPPTEHLGSVLLSVQDLTARHKGPGFLVRRSFEVLHRISLQIRGGETLGIVGESGSGKTTLARILIGLHPPQSGLLRYGDFDLSIPARSRPLQIRRELQIIFQSPETALNPKLRVGDILLRRIRLFEHRDMEIARRRVLDLLASVGLRPDYATRRPAQLSGGEKQRVAIARALIGGPRIIICDEILSSLDVITQARIIQLMMRLQSELGLSLIFISHDIGVTAAIAHRILVFKDGVIREQGRTFEIMWNPTDAYTAQLISSSIVSMDEPSEGDVRASARLDDGPRTPAVDRRRGPPSSAP